MSRIISKEYFKTHVFGQLFSDELLPALGVEDFDIGDAVLALDDGSIEAEMAEKLVDSRAYHQLPTQSFQAVELRGGTGHGESYSLVIVVIPYVESQRLAFLAQYFVLECHV